MWHEAYVKVAPNPDAWPKVNEPTADSPAGGRGHMGVKAPTLLIIGDSGVVRPERTLEIV